MPGIDPAFGLGGAGLGGAGLGQGRKPGQTPPKKKSRSGNPAKRALEEG
jgi:hypothetical protein